MDRNCIVGILREHEQELRAAGLAHVRLFGSVARGDNTPESDVDLLFDCDDAGASSVLRAFGYQDRVAEMVGMRVHLTSAKHLKPALREHVLAEAVSAF